MYGQSNVSTNKTHALQKQDYRTDNLSEPFRTRFFFDKTHWVFRASRVKCDDSSHAGAPCGCQQNISIFPDTLALAQREQGWCLWKNSSGLQSSSIRLGCFLIDHWVWSWCISLEKVPRIWRACLQSLPVPTHATPSGQISPPSTASLRSETHNCFFATHGRNPQSHRQEMQDSQHSDPSFQALSSASLS